MSWAGPCLGEHGPAMELRVQQKLITMKNENIIQHREMSRAVTRVVGDHGLAIELKFIYLKAE